MDNEIEYEILCYKYVNIYLWNILMYILTVWHLYWVTSIFFSSVDDQWPHQCLSDRRPYCNYGNFLIHRAVMVYWIVTIVTKRVNSDRKRDTLQASGKARFCRINTEQKVQILKHVRRFTFLQTPELHTDRLPGWYRLYTHRKPSIKALSNQSNFVDLNVKLTAEGAKEQGWPGRKCNSKKVKRKIWTVWQFSYTADAAI